MTQVSAPKVSVIVPTYRSNHHLDELVVSLDAQTLPQDEFEVLLVDDGSPDDTFTRLQAFARTRPNYRPFQLPPSGWPSLPRNRGIDEARGAYIVFLDHDDRIFPDGLRAAYELAARTGADVLDGKESKSNTPGWWMRDVDVDANVDNAIDWIDPHPLLPMNPHKMFRTAFLREQGIRFPVGGRQIWEDIHFDIAAHARAQVVSLLVETPFYYWNRPKQQTTSGTFYDDLGEYLEAIARVFRWIDEELAQERFARLRERFLAYQLHMRVLPLFFRSDRSDAERAQIRAFTTTLMPQIPDVADAHLDPWRRIKVALLRAGRYDLVDRHESTGIRLVCVATARTPVFGTTPWCADGLRVDVDIAWELDSPSGSAVVRQGERVELALDPEVAAYAAEHGLQTDVTDWLGRATYAVDRRARSQKVDWRLSFATAPALSADGGTAPLLAATQPLAWDLVDDGAGRLHDGVWDLYVRTVVLRTRVVRQVRTADTARHWAVVNGRLVAAYRTRNGCLSIDVGQTAVSVVDDDLGAIEVSDGRFVIDLPGVEVFSDLDVAGRLVGRDGTAVGVCRVVAVDGRAQLRGAFAGGDVPAGPFAVAFGQRVSRTRFVTRQGSLTVRRPRPEPQLSRRARRLARRVWDLVPEKLRRRFWIWRHSR